MLKRFAGISEKTLRALCAAAIFAVAATPVRAEDRTISADYTLAADETVEGVLTIESGATVDLAGHKLTVKGLAGDGTIAGTGVLYVDTAGGTVANSTVSLTGGLKLTVGGGGTFTASKASQSYTGGTEAAADTTISLGTATHPLGNGNATQTVTLGEGAQLKYNNLQNASTCCYSFILHQGSVVDAGSNSGRWVRHFKDITLQGNATFKAQSNICVGTNTGSVPCLVTLNGHTLYLNLNGDHNMRGFKTVGEGKVVFQAGGASFYGTAALPVDFSSATLGFEGSGWFFNGNSGITVGNLYFKSSTKKWRSQGAQESYVLGTYTAGDFRAPFTMKSGATLDLSEMTGTWNAHGLPIDAANTDRSGTGRVTFLAADAAYTVDVGTRTIAKGDVLARFESGYVPTDSVVFNLAATGAAQTPEDLHLGVVAKDSGSGYYNLVVRDTLTPYARWVIDNDNPANSGWKFYNPTDDTENTDWRDGVTDDVEVRIFSYAEHQAIVAAGVSPFRYSLYGTIQIPGDAAEWNLTTFHRPQRQETLLEQGQLRRHDHGHFRRHGSSRRTPCDRGERDDCEHAGHAHRESEAREGRGGHVHRIQGEPVLHRRHRGAGGHAHARHGHASARRRQRHADGHGGWQWNPESSNLQEREHMLLQPRP